MNYLSKALEQPTKNEDAIITEIRNEIISKKIKFGLTPEECDFKPAKNGIKLVRKDNIFYYLNCIPKIYKDRDVYKKPNSIGEIRIDLDNKITPENFKEESLKLKPQYCFMFNTCLAPYTKASTKYPHYYIIIFDKLKDCEKYMEFFNKCFKTIQEKEAEEEKEIEEKKLYLKMKNAREVYQKLSANNKKIAVGNK